MTNQCTNTILNFLSQLAQWDTGFRDGLGILTDLAMNFGGFAIVTEEIVIHVIYHRQVPELLMSGALEVFIMNVILDNLAFWIRTVAE